MIGIRSATVGMGCGGDAAGMELALAWTPPAASGSARDPLRLLMRCVVLSGLAGIATAPFFTITVLHRLGTDDRVVALLNCVTAAAGLVALPAAWLLHGVRPRLATVGMVGLMRLGPLLVLLAWLGRGWLGDGATWLAAGGLAMMAICGSACSGPHDAWMRAVVPGRLIGGFLGRRVALATLLAGISCPLAGLALERWGDAAIAPILVWGLALMLAELPLLLQVGDGRPGADLGGRGPGLLARWRDPAFRRPLLAHLPLLAATALAGPWTIIALYDLGCSAGVVAVIATVQTLGGALGIALGGARADRGDPLLLLARLGRWRAASILAMAAAAVLAALHHPLALPAILAAAACDAGLGGAMGATATRFGFRLVPDGAPAGFAAVGVLRSATGVAGTLLGTAIGSLVIANREAVAAAIPGCHYLVVVLVVSAVATAGCAWLAGQAGRPPAGPAAGMPTG